MIDINGFSFTYIKMFLSVQVIGGREVKCKGTIFLIHGMKPYRGIGSATPFILNHVSR